MSSIAFAIQSYRLKPELALFTGIWASMASMEYMESLMARFFRLAPPFLARKMLMDLMAEAPTPCFLTLWRTLPSQAALMTFRVLSRFLPVWSKS